MTMLILDTSRNEGFAALTRSGAILDVITCPSKEFLPHAAHLAHHGPLEAIAIGVGPGSYTGTRAGATFAKTFAFAKNIPVIGFYSPLAYLPMSAGPFAATLPAKQGDVCLLTGNKTTETILDHAAPLLVPKDALPRVNAHVVESATAPLHLSPLSTYLYRRLEEGAFDPSGEVDIAYLYALPAPRGAQLYTS